MYIKYKSNKLKKKCEDFKKAKAEHGEQCAKKLIQRLQEIEAAPNLGELNNLPPTHCHPLTGKWKGQFAVNLKQPFRLRFMPLGDDEEIKPNGVLDITKVLGVKMLEIGDYH